MSVVGVKKNFYLLEESLSKVSWGDKLLKCIIDFFIRKVIKNDVLVDKTL